ncbi:MAG: hypothetical protein IKA61_00405 [Clostridia bacterium]|nr:hypothetical protein [Clostridia bacterium]MBR2336394.1 hypothetical protein [Clostridia bacterium]
MKTLKQIREDLMEIKFYYSKEKEIKEAGNITGLIRLAETVKAYNEAVSNAKGQLYMLYVALYVHNNSQMVVADDWDCSVDYIKRLNRQLLQYLQGALKI